MDATKINAETPTVWLRRLVADWLLVRDPETFRRWLNGDGFPPIGHREEPFSLILAGLPQGGARADAEAKMAEVVRAELQSTLRGSVLPVEAVWNLLLLAGGLSVPDVLGSVLDRWVECHYFAGVKVNGIPLTSAVRSAVIENQTDCRYRDEWMALVRGERHPYFGTGVTAGFEGVLWMRSANGEPGPDIDAIGDALRFVAKDLDANSTLQPRRRPEFRAFLARVTNAYPNVDWPAEFVRVADLKNWDRWAVESLPSLLFPFPRKLEKQGSVEYVVWAPLTRLLRDVPVARHLCSGNVAVVVVSTAKAGQLQNDVRSFEVLRQNHDLPTSTSMLNTIAGSIAALDDSQRMNRQKFEEAHDSLLTEMNLKYRRRRRSL